MRYPQGLASVSVPAGRKSALECRRLSPEWGDGLMQFLEDLRRAGDDEYFKPHEFTREAVDGFCLHAGEDLYFVLAEGVRVLGYGLLRGWNEGYAVPSLGIAIHPDARKSGLGRALMAFLHAAAIRHGAVRVRLKVSPGNVKAIALYRSLGYVFGNEEEGLMVGLLDLKGGA